MTTELLFQGAPAEIGAIETVKTETNCWYIKIYDYEKDMEVTALRVDEKFGSHKGGHDRKNENTGEMDELTLKKSQQRSRINARRKCFALAVDRLLTLTFRENITDVEEARLVLKYFLKLMRIEFPEFSYIAVPELQKRGAVHFHLAIRGRYPVTALRRLWHRAVGSRGGNIDITNPRKFGKNSWNPRRVAQYLGKYITKANCTSFNKRRYSTGGDIPQPCIHKGFVPFNPNMKNIVNKLFLYLYGIEPENLYENEEGYYPLIYAST